jgi:hypothetical protein
MLDLLLLNTRMVVDRSECLACARYYQSTNIMYYRYVPYVHSDFSFALPLFAKLKNS